jgi:hypothetical protein
MIAAITPDRPTLAMLPKLIIIALLLAIVVSLFSGLFFVLKDPSSSRRALTSLKVRVGLSIVLIVFLMLSFYFGWIQPHGVRP